jgi:hypothetical protein
MYSFDTNFNHTHQIFLCLFMANLTMLSIPQASLYSVEWWDLWTTDLKRCGRKRWWPIWGIHYLGICIERTKKTTKTSLRIADLETKDLNQGPPEYESGVLTTRQQRLVAFVKFLEDEGEKKKKRWERKARKREGAATYINKNQRK